MKKNKFKIILGLSLVVFLVVAILISSLKKRSEDGSDYKIGILADDGIAMVSMSRERQMINYLSLSNDSQVWIPGGMGWYRNQVIKKVLTQEKKVNLLKDILFFNFGFVVDKTVVLNKTNDWQQKFWWLLVSKNNLIRKNEILKDDTDVSEVFLDQIMPRDFSETKVVNDEVKISVVNVSGTDGLANFITKRLERAGFSVISVDSEDGRKLDKCVMVYGDGVEGTFSWLVLKSLFECDSQKDLTLNGNEIELYLDEKFSEVIKYSTYKK